MTHNGRARQTAGRCAGFGSASLPISRGLIQKETRMKHETDARVMTIYVNSTDQWHGAPLYAAIVKLCQERGIAGVTVVRGTEGYGSSGTLHTTRLLELSENLPMRIEIVDIAERIDPLLTALEPMLAEGLVTLTDVLAIRYLREPKRP
jgi:PII-like signaling protein